MTPSPDDYARADKYAHLYAERFPGTNKELDNLARCYIATRKELAEALARIEELEADAAIAKQTAGDEVCDRCGYCWDRHDNDCLAPAQAEGAEEAARLCELIAADNFYGPIDERCVRLLRLAASALRRQGQVDDAIWGALGRAVVAREVALKKYRQPGVPTAGPEADAFDDADIAYEAALTAAISARGKA